MGQIVLSGLGVKPKNRDTSVLFSRLGGPIGGLLRVKNAVPGRSKLIIRAKIPITSNRPVFPVEALRASRFSAWMDKTVFKPAS